jgi:glutaminase
MTSPIADYLARLHAELSALDSGHLADYIPELAKADPKDFGICITTMDGVSYSVGDAGKKFTIQSISKPFVYAAALADRGQGFVSGKVGVEPSGDAFNSISLDPKTGAPKNPMINAGAIASTSLVRGDDAPAQWQRIEAAMAVTLADRGVHPVTGQRALLAELTAPVLSDGQLRHVRLRGQLAV